MSNKIKSIYGCLQFSNRETIYLDGSTQPIITEDFDTNDITDFGTKSISDEANIFVIFEDGTEQMYRTLENVKQIIEHIKDST